MYGFGVKVSGFDSGNHERGANREAHQGSEGTNLTAKFQNALISETDSFLFWEILDRHTAECRGFTVKAI